MSGAGRSPAARDPVSPLHLQLSACTPSHATATLRFTPHTPHEQLRVTRMTAERPARGRPPSHEGTPTAMRCQLRGPLGLTPAPTSQHCPSASMPTLYAVPAPRTRAPELLHNDALVNAGRNRRMLQARGSQRARDATRAHLKAEQGGRVGVGVAAGDVPVGGHRDARALSPSAALKEQVLDAPFQAPPQSARLEAAVFQVCDPQLFQPCPALVLSVRACSHSSKCMLRLRRTCCRSVGQHLQDVVCEEEADGSGARREASL